MDNKQFFLNELTKLGKKTAHQADPQTYYHENRGRAKKYEHILKYLRLAYVNVRDDIETPEAATLWLIGHIKTGTERNHLHLVHLAMQGLLNNECWVVVDNKLEHQR